MAKGLFRRAVVQSGGWSIVSMPERKEVEHQIKALSIEVLGDENASLEQLRKIDAQELALALTSHLPNSDLARRLATLLCPLVYAT